MKTKEQLAEDHYYEVKNTTPDQDFLSGYDAALQNIDWKGIEKELLLNSEDASTRIIAMGVFDFI